MPRLHAALGMASPAKRTGAEPSRPRNNRPPDKERADIFMRFPPRISIKPRKTIFYMKCVSLQRKHSGAKRQYPDPVPSVLPVSSVVETFCLSFAFVSFGVDCFSRFYNRNTH